MTLARLAAVAIALTVAQFSIAQNFPAKPIRLIVPFAPGGGNDVLGRMFAQRMAESTGQSVIVDNRPGGGGNIGTELVAHGTPDGYLLLYTTNSFAIGPALYPKLGYNIAELAPVSLVATIPFVMTVNSSLGVNSARELVALLRAKPVRWRSAQAR